MISGTSLACAPVVGIDFETYWKKDEYSVSDLGYWAYTHEPRFLSYCVGFGDPATGFSVAGAPPTVSASEWMALAGSPLWVSHNAAFDQAVFLRLQELGVIPAGLWPRRWLCTGALAGYLQGPRDLQRFARAVLGVEVSKEYRKAASGYKPGTDFFLDDTLREACALDALTCARIWAARGTEWPEHERRLWEQTVECGRYGVGLDLGFVRSGLEELRGKAASFAGLLPWTKAPYHKTARSRNGLEVCCEGLGVPAPRSTNDDSPELAQWMEKHGQTPAAEWVRHLQGFRRMDRKAALFESMLTRTNPETSRMDFELIYCGTAATGRWTGSNGLNMQNLNRDEKGSTTNPRQAFVPAPGKAFVIADLAQIEPRVLAWVVDDQALLGMVRAGTNIYEAHARTTMGWAGGSLKKEDPRLYQLAKVRVIQLGYQSAWETFQRACFDLAGLKLSDDEAQQQVMDYRKANPTRVTLWSRMEQAMEACEGGTYRMPLPSGRVVRYFDVEKVEHRGGKYSRLKAATVYGGEKDEWYGGKLTENLVQAIARDVFASGLLRLEAAGLPPVWHVHDEVILEVAEDRAEEAAKQVLEILSVTPAWIPGLPVGAEVQVTKHYVK